MPNTGHTFQLGAPVIHRGVAITPLFPLRTPETAYITLDEALPRGLRIEETSDAGSVPELIVTNPLDQRVLLYDGEELLGAKQNRILNITVLIEAGAMLAIPVSCVEAGRWNRQSAKFGAATHISHAELRRRKAETLAASPLARGLAQQEVWDAVADKAARMHVRSSTAANADTFTAHATRLDELERAFPLQPGQSGALMALDEQICLDWVSRPDAFARLWPKLRRGYLLDAFEHRDQPTTDPRGITAAFITSLGSATRSRGPSAGLGDDIRLNEDRVIGSGLELDGELLQLSAYSSTPGAQPTRTIARPSRRRNP